MSESALAPAPLHAPKPPAQRRARRELAAKLWSSGLTFAAIHAALIEAGHDVSARTVQSDLGLASRHARLDTSRRLGRHRERVLAQLAHETTAAFAAGDRHAGMRGVALRLKVLGLIGPDSVVNVGVLSTTEHVSTPLPALLERLASTVRAQFGEITRPPIEARLEHAVSNGSAA